MPAQFRIDQVTPGAGTAGRSRHDLISGEIITLTATDPAPGTGITYAWEILDRRGSVAVLSATSGQVVTIGPAEDVSQPSAFLIELVVTTPSGVTRTKRIASVRTALAQLRVPLFSETAPEANKLDINTPDLSTDNAVYADRSGMGVSEQNAFGWSEWAWELVNAVEDVSAAAGASSLVRCIGYDDFTENAANAWLVDTSNGGSAQQAGSAAAFGFPGAGVVKLDVGATPGSSAFMARVWTGLVVGVDMPLVVMFRYRPINSEGVLSDIEHMRFLGVLADAGLVNAIIFAAQWNEAESERTYSLIVRKEGVNTTEPVTMPALGDGTGFLAKLTVTPAGVTLEIGVDAGSLAVVAVVAEAPTATVYAPFMSLAKEDGGGEHAVLVDSVAWDGWRYASDANSAALGEFSNIESGGVTNHGDLTGLSDNDHPQYLLVTDAAAEYLALDGAVPMSGTLQMNANPISMTGGSVTGVDTISATTANIAAVNAGDLAVSGTAQVGSSNIVTEATKRTLSVTAVQTGNYTILPTDDVVLVDDTAGAIQLTAPLLTNARSVMIQKVAGGTGGISIVRTSTEQINGVAATYALPGSTAPWASATPQAWTLYSDGTNRYVA